MTEPITFEHVLQTSTFALGNR